MVHSRRVMVARARPRASRSRAKLSMSARRTANRFREWARHQEVNWRRSSAYASRVSPRYPARNPARASRSASLNAGWIGTRAVVVAVIGYLPVRAETEGDWASRGPSNDKVTTVKPPCPSRHVTACSRAEPTLRREAFEIAESVRLAVPGAQICLEHISAHSGGADPACDPTQDSHQTTSESA